SWSNRPSMGCFEFRQSPVVASPRIILTNNPPGFVLSAPFMGQPPFSFQWLKNGVPLTDDGHYHNSSASNLVVFSVLPTDAAAFQLVVSNAFGVTTGDMGQVVIHFVDASGSNPMTPYSTWATAATNIQDAIDSSTAGDIVLATNGIYSSGG